jgi:uncharacterized protein (TIGR03086 family)
MASDLPDLHARAVENTQSIVDFVTADQLGEPTPCSDWSVSQLLHHVVYGNLWVTPLVGGETIEQVGDRFEGDILGENFAAAYRSSGRAAVDTFNASGAMDAPCAVSYGPVPGRVYCGHRFIDVLVHGWDLAAATGGNIQLPPDLVEACIEVVRPQAQMLGASGMFGSAVADGSDMSPQSKLLGLLGRTS